MPPHLEAAGGRGHLGNLGREPGLVPNSVQETVMAPRLRGNLWKVPASVQEAVLAVTSVQEVMVVPASIQEAEMAVRSV